MTAAHPARWWHRLDDGRLQCDLCPRDCRLQDGQRGLCFVRQRQGEGLVLTTWGRSSGFCIDPIEKKPLYHVHPGGAILSFGTAGCNLACKFCQNWEISKAHADDRRMASATPDAIAAAADRYGAAAVAYTYNDPVIFAEYAIDTALACRERGLLNVAVTAGYIHPAPRRAFFAAMDAANVDLKAFHDDFYRRLCAGRLDPVLDTLRHLVHDTACWTEITTLLIPGHNDGDTELSALCRWVRRELNADVPLHFTAFHPDWKLTGVPPTPPATLTRAREIGRAEGLHHVYTGNVRDPAGATTHCAGCGTALIGRDGYRLSTCRLTAAGACPDCGVTLAGRFDAIPPDQRLRQSFGNRRIPVALSA